VVVGAGVVGAGVVAVLVGTGVAVDVLGAWTAGSDFSPQPAAAVPRARAAAHAAMVRAARRRPAFQKGLTARTVTKAARAGRYAASE
jgi:hypothetical protein